MVEDITKIPMEELENDLHDTIEDIAVYEMALSGGVNKYSKDSARKCLDINKKIEKIIRNEIERRQHIVMLFKAHDKEA